MAKKFNWAIYRAEYGAQEPVIANTRADAIAAAEARFLDDHSWELELVGTINDDGTIFTRSPIPEYTAKKI